MPTDKNEKWHYYNDYDVTDFWIRFPHFPLNYLFMPVIHYVRYGEDVYERIFMPLGDWFRLFRQEGIHPETDLEDPERGYHFTKVTLVHRTGVFFESHDEDYEGYDDLDEDEIAEYERMKHDGGGEFENVVAEWFILKDEKYVREEPHRK